MKDPPVHGPYEREPPSETLSLEEKWELVNQALEGVELGEFDRIVVAWTVRTLDSSALRAILGWIERAKECRPDDDRAPP